MGDSNSPAGTAHKKSKRDAAGDGPKPPSLAVRWRDFWLWRSGARMVWALILAVLALLAMIYLALPANDKAIVVAGSQTGIQWVGQSLSAASLRVAMILALVVGVGASMALLLSPVSPVRAYKYPFPPASVASNMTVLLDTENLAGNIACESLLSEILDDLRKMPLVSGKGTRTRADLLFFLDARQLHSGSTVAPPGADENWLRRLNGAYNTLVEFGFRLINSPHNPTGTHRLKNREARRPRDRYEVKEAADREIEFLAFERALLSPVKQKFIIVSGDGDFAPLIYHLIALGHEVQVWKWGPTQVYDKMSDAVPSLVVVAYPKPKDDVPDDGGEGAPAGPPTATGAEPALASAPQSHATSPAQAADESKKFVFTPRTPTAVEFPQSGMYALYYAIDNTAELCASLGKLPVAVVAKRQMLGVTLGANAIKRSLSVVGFTGKGSSLSWLRMLDAVDALSQSEGGLPEQGATTPPLAARHLFAMALAAAQAAASAMRDPHDDVSIEAIRDQLVAPDLAQGEAQALQTLLKDAPNTSKVDAHFLVWCARALGLLEFEEVPKAAHLIRSPRLTPLAERIIRPDAEGPADAPQAD